MKKENKMTNQNKIKEIKQLVEKIQKLSGKKVIFKEKEKKISISEIKQLVGKLEKLSKKKVVFFENEKPEDKKKKVKKAFNKEKTKVLKEMPSYIRGVKQGDNEEEKFDPDEVQRGDLVDFGSYGELYVCSTSSSNGWWVTDKEEDRANSSASGWGMRPQYAKGIVQSYFDVQNGSDDEEDNDDGWRDDSNPEDNEIE